ncbi:MAG: hypothetical protein WKF82_06355 [Nocardioidaceae bacterium]
MSIRPFRLFENTAAAKAFASLPERWQLVLWHLEVERQKPADVAPLLGLTANSVSALAYRAREGLRQAYLQMHMADTAGEECRWVTERLGAHVRNGPVSPRRSQGRPASRTSVLVAPAVYLELTEVERQPLRDHRAAVARFGGCAPTLPGAPRSSAAVGAVVRLGKGRATFATANTAATTASAAAASQCGRHRRCRGGRRHQRARIEQATAPPRTSRSANPSVP